jgi:hypothetical protein
MILVGVIYEQTIVHTPGSTIPPRPRWQVTPFSVECMASVTWAPSGWYAKHLRHTASRHGTKWYSLNYNCNLSDVIVRHSWNILCFGCVHPRIVGVIQGQNCCATFAGYFAGELMTPGFSRLVPYNMCVLSYM